MGISMGLIVEGVGIYGPGTMVEEMETSFRLGMATTRTESHTSMATPLLDPNCSSALLRSCICPT